MPFSNLIPKIESQREVGGNARGFGVFLPVSLYYKMLLGSCLLVSEVTNAISTEKNNVM